MACKHCDDGEGMSVFPYYGVAPHVCFHHIPGARLGQSRELPEDQWPENFMLDPECGPADGLPRTGAYTHCLHCGAGGRKCFACAGEGYTVEPECCGRAHLGGCCGDPDPVQVPCDQCQGKGVLTDV